MTQNICSKLPKPIYFILTFIIALLFLSSCSDNTELSNTSSLGDETEKQVDTKEMSIDYFDWDAPHKIKISEIQYSLIEDNLQYVSMLYRDKQFDAIEQHITSLLSQENEDKENQLYRLYNSLGAVTDLKHKDLMSDTLNEWCQQSTTQIPWVVRGIFYIRAGWKIRGIGLSSTVRKQSKAQFHQYLQLAQNDLEKAISINPFDANSYCNLLIIARALSFSEEDMENYFQKGIAVSPWHIGLYLHKLIYLKPKWHGSLKQVAAFIDENRALVDDHPKIGLIINEALAEIHFATSKKEEDRDLQKDWAIIEKNYEKIFADYPDDIVSRFYYSFHAIKMQKWEVAIKQFDIIGERWLNGACYFTLDHYHDNRKLAYSNQGIVLFSKKLYGPAEAYFAKALKYQQNANQYYYLAQAQWAQASSTGSILYWKKTEESLIKALQYDPDHKGIKDDLTKVQKYLRKIGHA